MKTLGQLPPSTAVPIGTYTYSQGANGNPAFTADSLPVLDLSPDVQATAYNLASNYALYGGSMSAYVDGYYLLLNKTILSDGRLVLVVNVYRLSANPNIDILLQHGEVYRLGGYAGGNFLFQPTRGQGLYQWLGVTGAQASTQVPGNVTVTPIVQPVPTTTFHSIGAPMNHRFPQGIGQVGLGQSGTVPGAGTSVSGSTNAAGGATSGPIMDGTASNLLILISNNPNQSGCQSSTLVSNFQTSYNNAYNGNLTVDGKYGQATDTALRAVLGASVPAVTLCAAAAAPAPGPSPAPIQPTPPAPISTVVTVAPPATSNTGLIVGGLIVAAIAVGGIAYAYKKHPTTVTSARPSNIRTRRVTHRRYA